MVLGNADEAIDSRNPPERVRVDHTLRPGCRAPLMLHWLSNNELTILVLLVLLEGPVTLRLAGFPWRSASPAMSSSTRCVGDESSRPLDIVVYRNQHAAIHPNGRSILIAIRGSISRHLDKFLLWIPPDLCSSKLLRTCFLLAPDFLLFPSEIHGS